MTGCTPRLLDEMQAYEKFVSLPPIFSNQGKYPLPQLYRHYILTHIECNMKLTSSSAPLKGGRRRNAIYSTSRSVLISAIFFFLQKCLKGIGKGKGTNSTMRSKHVRKLYCCQCFLQLFLVLKNCRIGRQPLSKSFPFALCPYCATEAESKSETQC